MARKLFCEINPLTYAISVRKMRLSRHFKNIKRKRGFASSKSQELLPVVACRHKSLIIRGTEVVGREVQEGKAKNLAIAAPQISGILIKPGETFSFWHLLGAITRRKGYVEGLVLNKGALSTTVGGGLCQFTNLIHWMVLHSPLDVVERHSHDDVDIYPDASAVPFGLGTSIMYNYLDYRFRNNTKCTFQLIMSVDETHLLGELRTCRIQKYSYNIVETDSQFVREGENIYRQNTVVRRVINNDTDAFESEEIIQKSHAKVLYQME